MTETLVLRPYQSTDREQVLQLAADTAFFGEPVEVILEDRRLFCDLVYAYYTDDEPELAWVAVEDSYLMGFIVGAVDTARQQRVVREQIAPRVAAGVLRGRYRTGPLTWRWLGRLGSSALRRDLADVDLHQYPAHLHINVDGRSRGKGVGRQLMERYLEHLRALGVAGVHLHTTDRNVAACILYERLGMRLLDARPTRLWSHVVSEPVESRCYGIAFREVA
jgi:ribosomal protein S18 acetylase RimI-like enzyme